MKNEAEVIKFLKANLGECCAELCEYRKTDILPVGMIWEAMSISEEGVVNSILVLVEKLAVEAIAEEYKPLDSGNEVTFLQAPDIKIPNITVQILEDSVIILFKNSDGLLKFSTPRPVSPLEVVEAVNQELAGLDWDQDFDYVFSHQAYRKAIMNVVNKLFE